MDKKSDIVEGLCAVLMLKDENRFILNEDGTKCNPPMTMLEQNIRSLNKYVDEIYIVDNGSTDGSDSVYEKYKYDNGNGRIVYLHKNDPNLPFDDVRDRKIMLNKAKERGMKWLLVVDGDEIYEDRSVEWIKNYCRNEDLSINHIVSFHYINFWRSRTKYRVDKWFTSYFMRLFSVNNLILSGTALHNYSFNHGGSNSKIVKCPYECLHYGWADWEHRVRKTQRYISRDMEVNRISYEHAKSKYSNDIDENGIRFEQANKEWGSEFANGIIDY